MPSKPIDQFLQDTAAEWDDGSEDEDHFDVAVVPADPYDSDEENVHANEEDELGVEAEPNPLLKKAEESYPKKRDWGKTIKLPPFPPHRRILPVTSVRFADGRRLESS